jgi:hypothetical protein
LYHPAVRVKGDETGSHQAEGRQESRMSASSGGKPGPLFRTMR